MKAKKFAPLIVALILGLISARMVVKIIQNKGGGGATASVKIAKVVVAAKDVAAGEELQPDDLSLGDILADSVPPSSFSDPVQLGGRVAAAPFVRGQTILESLLTSKGSGSGLQAVIPSGMRALTLDINEVSGVAGYITPGCRVDIVQMFHDTATNQSIDRCLVQDVTVTAVGTRPQPGQDNGTLAHSVTLLVTPHQAAMIDLASVNGRPRLVLRNGQDHETKDVPNVTLAEIAGSTDPGAPPVQAGADTRPTDIFGATTQPVARGSDFQIRIISGGESSVAHVPAAAAATTTVPARVNRSSMTNTDAKEATGP